MTKITERSDSLDVLRGMALLLVIYGHVLVLYATAPAPWNGAVFTATQAIYAFHMPLFFFISGITYRKKGLRSAVTGAVALVLFAQITHLFGIALDRVFNGTPLDPVAVVRTLVQLRNFSIGVTWFLVALAVIRLFFALLHEGRLLVRLLVSVLLVISFVVSFRTNTTIFQVQTWWAGMIFYAAGQALAVPVMGYFSKTPRGQGVALRWLAVLAMAALLTLIAAANRGCFASPLAGCGSENLHGRFIVRMIIGNYGFVPLFGLAAACGCLFMILLARGLADLPHRLYAACVWMGRKTLPLLVLNGCFLLVANPWIKTLAAADYPGWQPWVLGLAVVAAHLVVLPLISPAVDGVERGMARLAAALTDRLWKRPAAS